ncbi:virulence factor TspB C-terminal domain-related protein [Rheinheimera fenheensis]|uniref:virulence factor TspB C-terminal domain-related protein n=1 Tax=Rheinheimera fenheensis TaxID=3152295 RepID=UPI00325FF1D1
MQKALILALLIGAFLLPCYVTAQSSQDLACAPTGGAYSEHSQLGPICAAAAQPGYLYTVTSSGYSATATSIEQAANDVAAQRSITDSVETCPAVNDYSYVSHSPDGSVAFTVTQKRYDYYGGTCNMRSSYPRTVTSSGSWSQGAPTHTCPPDGAPQLTGSFGEGETAICYTSVPIDQEPPPECDIGDCNPPEEPKCFRGGNGQLVCFEDPNEKCDVTSAEIGEPGNSEPVYSNCETGCGFVQDNFLCSEEPDIPSLDNCLVTTNGYACPADIPEPDDSIDNPEKPIDNMVKGDFKDVLLGVETRTDATNKLISDQIARDAENTEKLAVGLGKANQYLAAIDKNTKEIADGMDDLKGDGSSADLGTGAQFKAEIQNALGITGDETIEDLTVAEVSLDDFTDDFQWSLGPDQCPQPRAINMLGKTFYMDWGPFCEAFTVLGYLILAAAYFFATLIAFRGK